MPKMPNDPLKNYEKRVREEGLAKSAVVFLLAMINEDKIGFDNDSILRIGKIVKDEIVKVVAEKERTEGKGSN